MSWHIFPMFGNCCDPKKYHPSALSHIFNMLAENGHLARPMQYIWHERPTRSPTNRRQTMSTINSLFSRNMLALVAALLMGTTFIAAATGPAMVTPAFNSDIVA
jgi:uncharacterized Tic20 family protein